MSQLIQLSKHRFIYRGFTIQKCPRNPITLLNTYIISNDGNYYGRDFALSEALVVIDSLHVDGAKNETSLR